MSSTPASQPPTRLAPAVVLFIGSVVCWLIFTFGFAQAPKMAVDPLCGISSGDVSSTASSDTQAHGAHGQAEPKQTEDEPAEIGPNYFAGGFWSDGLGLSTLSELAVGLKAGREPVTVFSLGWANDKLVVRDVSPISSASASDDAPGLVVISIDHSGPDPSPEFGNAIKAYVEKVTGAKKMTVLPPLPGKDKVPDSEFPYDWYYLLVNDKIDLVDWTITEPKPDAPGYPGSGYLLAWMGSETNSADPSAHSAAELLGKLKDAKDPGTAAGLYFELVARGPYEVVPALEKDAGSTVSMPQALLLHRLMGAHADGLIAASVTSEDASLRAAAARAIGDLADVTSDPIGKLTLLAEDKVMAVRSEALIACAKIGGRAAAGVAQLVGDYEMSEPLRDSFQAIMPILLAAGEPIQPDSRAARLRRLALSDLLNEERDALVCKVLLERSDLPDNQVKTIVEQLGKAQSTPPVAALLDLLESLSPRQLAERSILIKTLVEWDRPALFQQNKRLNAITNSDANDTLRSAAAGAIIQSSSISGTEMTPTTDGILFKGLKWVTDPKMSASMADLLFDAALNANSVIPAARQIAALNAVQHLPANAIKKSQVETMLTIARTSDDVAIRFAAIGAMNDLPNAMKPPGIDDLALTRITVRSVVGKLAFDQTELSITANRPVELTLINPDTMPHNLVITKPGKAQAIGMQITNMGTAQAAAIGYLPPDSPDVLHATTMVSAGASDTLRFIAPTTPGDYDYVCTFPGHSNTMVGTLKVVAP